MKTPIYESSPGAGATLINSGSFVFVTLYTITLFGAQGVIRLTDADRDVTYGGNTWNSRGPQIDQREQKALAHWKRGLDLDTWVVTIAPRNVDPVTGAAFPDLIGSVPWIAAARCGALDGADVQVDRAYFASFPQPYTPSMAPTAVYTIFAGRPAEVDTTDTVVVVTLNDYRELLSQQMPRNVYQASCRHTLYDSGCALNQASFAVAGSLIGGSTPSVLQSKSLVAGGSGTFTLGKVIMTSGLNNGFSRTVRAWDGKGQFSLLNPLPFNVMPGDTFNAYPGCDKQMATCTAFANLVNFGGEPYVPDATTAV